MASLVLFSWEGSATNLEDKTCIPCAGGEYATDCLHLRAPVFEAGDERCIPYLGRVVPVWVVLPVPPF